MIKVVPAIIPHDKEQLISEINLVSPFASLVQVDISDGLFTKYKTWPYTGIDADFFQKLKTQEVGWPKWEATDIEVHLMIEKPETVVQDWIDTGVSSIVVQIEATEKMTKIIEICKKSDVAIWIAIKPSTDIQLLAPFVSDIDGIQCMGSDLLGKHGVELEEKAVEQIKKLHNLNPERIISVDIGVNEDTRDILVSAGAQKLIVGSAILEADDPQEAFFDLQGE